MDKKPMNSYLKANKKPLMAGAVGGLLALEAFVLYRDKKRKA